MSRIEIVEVPQEDLLNFIKSQLGQAKEGNWTPLIPTRLGEADFGKKFRIRIRPLALQGFASISELKLMIDNVESPEEEVVNIIGAIQKNSEELENLDPGREVDWILSGDEALSVLSVLTSKLIETQHSLEPDLKTAHLAYYGINTLLSQLKSQDFPLNEVWASLLLDEAGKAVTSLNFSL